MQLGDFAGHHHGPLRPQHLDHIPQRLSQPVRRFVKDLGTRRISDLFQQLAPLAGFGRQESAEAERIGGQPAGGERGDKRRGAGDGNHRNTMADGERHQPVSRVRDGRHAGIGDQRDGAAFLGLLHQLGGARHLVVLVVTGGRRGDAVVVQQLLGLASVLAGDDVCLLQHTHGAQSDVFQIADRRSHHIECGARDLILLGRHSAPVYHLGTGGSDAEKTAMLLLPPLTI